MLRDNGDNDFSLEYNRGFRSEQYIPFDDIQSIKIFNGENIFKNACDYNVWGLFVKFNTSEELRDILTSKYNAKHNTP